MVKKRFLILRLSAVGDVIRTLPAVKLIKVYYPESSITWIAEEASKSLIDTQPEIDEVILFPRRRWKEGIKSLKYFVRTLIEVYKFILDIRKKKFDIVLDFHGILKSGIISFISGAPRRIGFNKPSSKELNYLFSNIKVRLKDERISRIKKNFALLNALGLRVDSFNTNLYIPPEDQKYIESFFKSLRLELKRPIIVIHPGTSQKTMYKRWDKNNYSQLSDRLIRELKATVIFTWGEDELELIEEIRTNMRETSVLGPRTESLTMLAEVFRRSDLYIGGDTGPMHIASLVGTPVVVIYGPTDPIVNEPIGYHKKVLKEVGCNPCRKRSCKELICLKNIEVEDVFQAAKEILAPKYVSSS